MTGTNRALAADWVRSQLCGMSRRPILAALLALLCAGRVCVAGLPDLAGRTVVVAVEDDYPPFNYVEPGSKAAVGWDYDTVRELGRRLHFKPEFREISWDSMIQAVATGQFDMAANGITVTAERARVVDFSQNYAQVRQRLMVRIGERRFHSLEEFAKTPKARIGAQKGNTNYTRAEDLVGAARTVAYDDFGELVQALLTGDLDAVLVDDVAGQGYVGTHAEELTLLEGSLAAQDLAMVFPKGSPLRAGVDAALEEMRKDGTLGRISGRWFQPKAKPAAP